MSWSMDFVAKDKRHALRLLEDEGVTRHVPSGVLEALKASVSSAADDVPVKVQTNGHVGHLGRCSANMGSFSVSSLGPIELLLDEPSEASAAG